MDDDVKNRYSSNITYLDWRDHARAIFVGHYKTFFLYLLTSFGVLWGFVEAASFFLRELELSSYFVLLACVAIATLIGLSRSVHDYLNAVPMGLEDESKEIQGIARKKAPYWEYQLAHALLTSRIGHIDQQMDDVLRNRVHVPVTRNMDVSEYIRWLDTRPANLLRMLEAAKQLLVFDLFTALRRDGEKELDLRCVVRIVDLIADLYKTALDFQITGMELKVPEVCSRVHQIQSEWVAVIQDGFRQMVNVLRLIATRDVVDKSPIEASIVFEAPPGINEFSEEMKRLEACLP